MRLQYVMNKWKFGKINISILNSFIVLYNSITRRVTCTISYFNMQIKCICIPITTNRIKEGKKFNL